MINLSSLTGAFMPSTSVPFYGGLPVFPGMPVTAPQARSAATPSASPRLLSDSTSPGLEFTQSEIDMLLYGYASPHNKSEAGLAISGLRLPEKTSLTGKGKSTTKMLTPEDVALIQIPPEVSIHHTVFGGLHHYSAFSSKTIKRGQRFGPFEGRTVHTSEIKTKDSNAHMWELFSGDQLEHFVDGRGAAGKWMTFINCARYDLEQNMDVVQVGDEIYYEANKDISEGRELLVWYGKGYEQHWGIPTGLLSSASNNETLSPPDDIHDTKPPENGTGYSCERCGKVFAYKYYRDKHLKYTKCVDQGDRKFPCNLCSRSFEKRDRLRIHILHVHEKHRPHKCTVCNKCFSQSSSLNKHMRVHSGERPYKCVYCNKAFTASSILRTHIRQHTHEKPFKCKFCGKAFASHAAHDSHVRRTHAKEGDTGGRSTGDASGGGVKGSC